MFEGNNFSIAIKNSRIEQIKSLAKKLSLEQWVVLLGVILAFAATWYSFGKGYIISYGDAESHLNIAKRVTDSLTPGFAQLGGVWLPLPHLLLIPFVYFNLLWRTGLAGSIVSGFCFVISSLFLYKLILLLTKNKAAGFVGTLVFMLNPNILYLQTTPMSELTLIVFFILSSYFFIRHLEEPKNIGLLILAAVFGFCAAISRYDGWFLVAMEALVLALVNLPWKEFPKSFKQVKEKWSSEKYRVMEGKVVLFTTLAFFSIALWLLWDWLILGDPLYFTNSEFSAKAQQLAWASRGELPASHHLWLAFLYYFLTVMSNAGVLIFVLFLSGLVLYLSRHKSLRSWLIMSILLAPFLFNVISLYLGQSVIFLPSLTPTTFDWTLFNVRYGVMMVPCVAVCCGYLFSQAKSISKIIIIGLAVCQIGLYAVGYSPVITLQDGVEGLSSEIHKVADAQQWINKNYDGGLLLQDDFARTISIIKSPVPMKNIIYIGNKPYYEDSLREPEKYATWIIMQKDDEIWKNLYQDPAMQGRLYKYFVKVYTSPEILIFKRNPSVLESG